MWHELAIAPTDDPRVIRRAYAARLKQIDPDRDREAFGRLRQALEWALARASAPPRRATPAAEPVREASPAGNVPAPAHDGAPTSPPRGTIRVFPAPPTPPAPRQPAAALASRLAEERAQERALLIGLEQALQQGDARAASQLYFRAAATGALRLGDVERMLARLFTIALDDRDFDRAAFRALAKSCGWDRPELGSAVVSEVRQRVSAKLAAEDWYDELLAIADRRKKGVSRHGARTARIVLRRIRGWGLVRIHRPALRVTLDSLKPHELWLRDRIPPDWVATIERRMRRREIIAHAIPAFFLAAILLNAALVFVGAVIGVVRDSDGWPLLVIIPVWAVLLWVLRAVLRNLVQVWRQRP